jgi:hypothetical protein
MDRIESRSADENAVSSRRASSGRSADAMVSSSPWPFVPSNRTD